MNNLTLKDILECCDGVYHGRAELLNVTITNYSYYLTSLKQDGLYFVYQNTIEDAELSINTAARRGAICCITDKMVQNISSTYIYVRDMTIATLKIAHYMRSFIKIPIIAITGSVGKTSTKDMIVSVLSQKYNVAKNSPYWNSNYRIAFSIFNIRDEHEISIIETAVGQPGDNESNGKVVRPDIAIITNIGDAHIGNFESQHHLFQEKRLILDYLAPTGFAYLNQDDPYINTISLNKPQQVKWFGVDAISEYRAENIQNLGLEGVECDLVHKDTRIHVVIPVPGVHFVNAAIIAFAIGLDFDVSINDIKIGIESFETSDHRSKVIQTEHITIIEDCFNASPVSVKAAVDTLCALDRRKVFIFGGIPNQLGSQIPKYHVEMGRYIAEKQIDVLIVVGPLSPHVLQGVAEVGGACKAYSVPEKKDLPELLTKVIEKGDVVLTKAIFADKFEEVTEMLKEL